MTELRARLHVPTSRFYLICGPTQTHLQPDGGRKEIVWGILLLCHLIVKKQWATRSGAASRAIRILSSALPENGRRGPRGCRLRNTFRPAPARRTRGATSRFARRDSARPRSLPATLSREMFPAEIRPH